MFSRAKYFLLLNIQFRLVTGLKRYIKEGLLLKYTDIIFNYPIRPDASGFKKIPI